MSMFDDPDFVVCTFECQCGVKISYVTAGATKVLCKICGQEVPIRILRQAKVGEVKEAFFKCPWCGETYAALSFLRCPRCGKPEKV